MTSWTIRVYISDDVTAERRARLDTDVPGLTGHGRSVGVGDYVEIDVDADDHISAVALARSAIERVLESNDVVRIIDADHVMQDRQVLLWVVATRVQVRRWERALARYLKPRLWSNAPEVPRDVWQAQIEWHLALVAANNLVRAVENARGRISPMQEDLATDIRVLRDLQEHWDEQWPAFYNKSNPGPLRRSGKSFASRHSGGDPYWWLGWNSQTGPSLGPGLEVDQIVRELDRIEREVLDSNPDLAQYLAAVEDSPWVTDPKAGRWWPR